MRKLVIITAAVILAMFGFANPSAAFPDNATVNDGDDATPNQADILTLTATSDGDGKGAGNGEIIVTMVLQGVSTLNGVKYRVHFDYTDDLATDHTPGDNGCEVGVRGTTSDDTMKTTRRGGGFKDTGPGAITGQGSNTLVFTVLYSELSKGTGVGDNTDVLIWADTHRKGIRDRAPDTGTGTGDPVDDCSKPEQLSEVLAITTDPAD